MPDNYGFLDEFIAGSAYPSTVDDLDQYLKDGIKIIISLTPNLPLVSKYIGDRDITFHHLPIYATPDQDQIEEFIATLLEIRESGGKVVVHCQYGQERTGILLAIYLVRIQKLSVKEAIRQVQKMRQGSLQTAHSNYYLQEQYND